MNLKELISRRSVLRFFGEEMPAAFLAEKGNALIYKVLNQISDDEVKSPHARADLIKAVLFSKSGATDVVASTYHPAIAPPVELADGYRTLTMDYWVMDEMKGLFEDQKFRVTEEPWASDSKNSLVCIGGARSNPAVANITGELADLSRGERPMGTVMTAEGLYRLPYAIAGTNFASEITSFQCGVETTEPEWIIVADEGRT